MKTTTRESLKGRMSVFAITMALFCLTLSGSTMALTGSLEDPVDPLTDAEYGLEDLLGINPSMSSTPIPGLTFTQIGVSEEVPVTLVEPGPTVDPIATLWTVNLTLPGGTFVTAPSIVTDMGICVPTGVDPIGTVCSSFCVDDSQGPCTPTMQHSACTFWRGLTQNLVPCEVRIPVADIYPVTLPSLDTGLRFCVYQYYVGLDAIPPEGEDDFGTELVELPGLSDNFSC